MIRLSPRQEGSQPAVVRLDRACLERQIARRRAQLAELEAAMAAACEDAAAGPGRRTCDDPGRRDRATRHRYLAAAMRLEAAYGPPMRRLAREIGQLERLTGLSISV